jgi:hypothetical protein
MSASQFTLLKAEAVTQISADLIAATDAIRNDAAAQAAVATAQAAIALGAANASGPTVIYATKAAADAALSGLAANAVIEVSADESRGGRRSRYRKTGGVFVFEIYVDAPKVIPVADQLRERIRTGRVDIKGLGDSNQLFGGHGWDDGIQYALATLGYPMWATGLVSQNENGGNGAGQGYEYGRSGSLIGATTGAPAALDAFLNKGAGSLFPASYTYLASGTTANNLPSGLILAAACPIDTSAALEFDFWEGTFGAGSGQTGISARIEESPFTSIASQAPISSNTGVEGMRRRTLAIAADAGRAGKPIAARPLVFNSSGITGPFFMTYMRFRRPARTTGWAYSTLNARGGQSARTMAYDLQQASDATLTHFFGIQRADQAGSANGLRTNIIWINEGLNDRNETLTSVGPAAIADGDSPEAFVDNHRAIIDRINYIYDLNGWPRNEIFPVFMPSHPVSHPDDAELLAYRDALEAYVQTVPRAQYINLQRLTTAAEMLSRGAYQSGGSDRNHLTQVAGYRWLALLALGVVA